MELYDRSRFAFEREACTLETSTDYRVLRRVPEFEELWVSPTPLGGPAFTLAVIDIETTGLGEQDSMIELAVVKLALDHQGQLCGIERPVVQLEDPGAPLSADAQRVTGLTDAVLAGQRFDERALMQQLDVDAIVAFNARFDAAFWRRRFPTLRRPWLCAYRDYDWAAAGFSERTQSALLAAHGHFYAAHRAAPDAWALAVLLAMPASDGRTIAAHVVDAGRKTGGRIAASQAPFSVKDELRSRGYRWDARRKVWTIDVTAEAASAECDALIALHPFIRPDIASVDWFNRHVE